MLRSGSPAALQAQGPLLLATEKMSSLKGSSVPFADLLVCLLHSLPGDQERGCQESNKGVVVKSKILTGV